MSVTKFAGIIAGLFLTALFALNFAHIHFGYYVTPANIPAIDVTAMKWVCGVLTLLSVYFLVDIIRAPALGHRSR